MMRVEISYKFIIGFLLVVASVVFMDMLVPYLGVAAELQKLVSTTCAIVVGLILGVWFSKVFTTNFHRVNDGANRLSHGDLSRQITINRPIFADETIELAESINCINDNLREVVSHIRATSESVASSASELSSTTIALTESSQHTSNGIEQIAQGAKQQAVMVDKAFTLTKEVALTSELVASSAKKVAISADLTAGAARNGGEKSELTAEIMKKILNEIEINEQRMIAFSSQLNKIVKFTEIIRDVANKTNLLSLNATIEATRAGEYGHGFAALAEEIRKLSDSTNNSTEEITQLIETIRQENWNILSSMTAIVTRMDEGRSALDISHRAFGEITLNATTTQTKATGIADLALQQAKGVQGIVTAIDGISHVVTNNASATEQAVTVTAKQCTTMSEIALAAKHLSTLAVDLMQLVNHFHLEDLADFPAARKVAKSKRRQI